MNKREIGTEGEKRAVKYLTEQGLVIIDTNYTCKLGEVDIIAKDNDTVVFIEVKYRKDIKMGRPYESVNHYKKMKIIKSAMWFAQKKGIYEKPMRFDIIEIVDQELHWIKNAFIIDNNSKLL